jgi:hypothetical protein
LQVRVFNDETSCIVIERQRLSITRTRLRQCVAPRSQKEYGRSEKSKKKTTQSFQLIIQWV